MNRVSHKGFTILPRVVRWQSDNNDDVHDDDESGYGGGNVDDSHDQ